MNQQIAASNRKAYHEYHILDKYEAGIELLGSEVKSLREAKANLKESYVIIRKNQAWISGMHINPYSNTGHEGHDPVRNRRLLLNKKEIIKTITLGRLETSEDFKSQTITEKPKEKRIEGLKISVRLLNKKDIEVRNLPNKVLPLPE